ncbi:hypothetical protein DXC10_14285 [Bacteroides sp. OM08-11]|nr:hypothetical protein DXC10_14285 [Bacteroides sp. OM08-11]
MCVSGNLGYIVLQRLRDKVINIVSALAVIDSKPIVKTQNGAIVLEDYEYVGTIKEGQILKTI